MIRSAGRSSLPPGPWSPVAVSCAGRRAANNASTQKQDQQPRSLIPRSDIPCSPTTSDSLFQCIPALPDPQISRRPPESFTLTNDAASGRVLVGIFVRGLIFSGITPQAPNGDANALAGFLPSQDGVRGSVADSMQQPVSGSRT